MRVEHGLHTRDNYGSRQMIGWVFNCLLESFFPCMPQTFVFWRIRVKYPKSRGKISWPTLWLCESRKKQNYWSKQWLLSTSAHELIWVFALFWRLLLLDWLLFAISYRLEMLNIGGGGKNFCSGHTAIIFIAREVSPCSCTGELRHPWTKHVCTHAHRNVRDTIK